MICCTHPARQAGEPASNGGRREWRRLGRPARESFSPNLYIHCDRNPGPNRNLTLGPSPNPKPDPNYNPNPNRNPTINPLFASFYFLRNGYTG
jgi:hypothetical protein